MITCSFTPESFSKTFGYYLEKNNISFSEDIRRTIFTILEYNDFNIISDSDFFLSLYNATTIWNSYEECAKNHYLSVSSFQDLYRNLYENHIFLKKTSDGKILEIDYDKVIFQS